MIKNDKRRYCLMNTNPYTLLFGKEPTETISRAAQKADIIDSFSSTPSTQQIYMITGVRGCGKTVFMTEISKELKESDDWIVVELKGSVPITNVQVAITKMLESIKKNGKKVLICVDEVTNNASMQAFASAFQIFIRQDLPLYLLMTGLYENINNLQNEDNLTFLYRAPKIELKPLNISTISANYKRTFELDDDSALFMAKLTKGYSFAFQVLGYFTWKMNGDYNAALPDYQQYLEDYVYEKIWSEMSSGDRKLAYGIAKSATGKASEIKTILEIENNEYTPYRDRLVKRGILDGSEHGHLKFILPLFEKYVLANY